MNVPGQILQEWKYEDFFLIIPKFPQHNYTTCSVLSARLPLLENVKFWFFHFQPVKQRPTFEAANFIISFIHYFIILNRFNITVNTGQHP